MKEILLNKKVLFSLGAIVMVAAAVTLGTGAFFSDTETSTGNILTAGAIDLQIDNHSYVTDEAGLMVESPSTTWQLSDLTNQLFFNFTDLKPGDVGEDTISLHVNSNDAYACMSIDLTGTPENDANEAEVSSGDSASDTTGELQNELNFAFWNDDGDNVYEVGETIFKQGLAKDLFDGEYLALADAQTNVWGASGPIEGGQTYNIGKVWCYGALTATPVAANGGQNPTVATGFLCDGAPVTNISQSDGILADVNFYAVQSRNNSGFTCGSMSIPEATVTEGTGWSPVDLDSTNGQAPNLGGGQDQSDWFAKARNNNANFEIAIGTDDDVPAGYSSAEAVWVGGATKNFTLSYDGSGNATLNIAGETPVLFAVDAVGNLARIGVNVKAPASVTTTVDGLALSVVGPLSDDDVTVTGGTNHLLITGANLNQAWTLTGTFVFSAVGTPPYSQENPAVQFSID